MMGLPFSLSFSSATARRPPAQGRPTIALPAIFSSLSLSLSSLNDGAPAASKQLTADGNNDNVSVLSLLQTRRGDESGCDSEGSPILLP